MKKYWSCIEEVEPAFQLFDPEDSPSAKREKRAIKISSSRRDFLKLFGYGLATAPLMTSCKKAVDKAIPFLIKPEESTPGKARYYLSSVFEGSDFASVMVKVRDGRPIKLEGNPQSSLNRGSTTARIQAMLLDLYNEERYQFPMKGGEAVSWEEALTGLRHKLLSCGDRRNILLTPTIISPTGRQIINRFVKSFPQTEWVEYDEISYSGLLEAVQEFTGRWGLPFYQIKKADLVLGINADFLSTWLMPLTFAQDYGERKRVGEKPDQILRHIQVESGMSLTGSNADWRIPIPAGMEGQILAVLYLLIAGKDIPSSLQNIFLPQLKRISEELIAAKGRSLVVTGSNKKEDQILALEINKELGNIGHSVDLSRLVNVKKGSDQRMIRLVEDMKRGQVATLFWWDVNPAYSWPDREGWIEGLKKVENKVAMGVAPNEAHEMADLQLPALHWLESWGDLEPVEGSFFLKQPVIGPLFHGKQCYSVLLELMEDSSSLMNHIKDFWTKNFFEGSKEGIAADRFWKVIVQKGGNLNISPNRREKIASVDIKSVISLVRPIDKGLKIQLYESLAMGDGTHSDNPWLQELPDPVTRVCWANLALVAPSLAASKGWSNGEKIFLEGVTLPVLIQPGQDPDTISVALGYGREVCGKAGRNVGTDVMALTNISKTRLYSLSLGEVHSLKEQVVIPNVQGHHSMEGRALVRETTSQAYQQNPTAGNEMHAKIVEHHTSLYEDMHFEGHHWGMVIDLNTCIGCNACVVACQVENNVPVVGADEVSRGHEMHWMRIDRYYRGKPDNPQVVRQPVLCQHCDNAPCENVCPVAATNHSSEGINQMAYNRCIGTRYCNNNCPYKVRRFNWYDYTGADSIPYNRKDEANMTVDLRRMALNPDVTVRAKGVIEKCSFCVQRIQEKKLTAKLEGRPLRDGEIQTACMQVCPTKAIVFGDFNDPDSHLSKLMQQQRGYQLLEELHTLPSVTYLTKVRQQKDNDELDS